jgi:hypothetical protein
MNPNLERFKRREERVVVDGVAFVARELSTAADMMALRDDPDYSLKILVRCIFMESGEPAFTDADIADMKEHTSIFKMAVLVQAVHRVNGMDAEAETKNSDAAPTGG